MSIGWSFETSNLEAGPARSGRDDGRFGVDLRRKVGGVPTAEKEATVVAFRTLLPLDGCLYALQTTIPI
jgi:hypothetical protein